MLMTDDAGRVLAVDVSNERRVQRGDVAKCLHECVRDQVGEADLPGAYPVLMLVEVAPVHLEQLRGKRVHARCRRYPEACNHVLDDSACRSAKRYRLLRGRSHLLGGDRYRCGDRRWRGHNGYGLRDRYRCGSQRASCTR